MKHPRLSYCIKREKIKPPKPEPIETRLVAKFNVTSTSSATKIMGGSFATSRYSNIEIDGVVQPSVVDTYTFATTGEHTVKYTLVNPTELGNSAFSGCTNLTSITIPESVTKFVAYVFWNCTGLTSVTIPESITYIGGSTFNGCTGLTSIIIPESVTYIYSYVCYGCTNLTSVTVLRTTPPFLSTSAGSEDWFTNNAPGRKIYVPAESVNAYKAANNWSTYAADIEAIPQN